MTMQNHTPWLGSNPESWDGKGKKVFSDEEIQTNLYSRLLQTDTATQSFLSLFFKNR